MLHRSWFVREFEEIDSTNSFAKALLTRDEASDGDVFHAFHQTSGRGRTGDREWNDNLGESLLLSVVLRERAENLEQLLQFLVALAGVDTLREFAPGAEDAIQLKWPNDLLINRKKAGGVLVE